MEIKGDMTKMRKQGIAINKKTDKDKDMEDRKRNENKKLASHGI